MSSGTDPAGPVIPDELETPRLKLRRWRLEDRNPFRRMNADPEVMRYFLAPLSAAESDGLADRIVQEFSRKGWGLWAVEPCSGEPLAGSFAGFIGFHEALFESDFTPCPEIGWRLDHRFWGRGYATEGARYCLDAGFRAFGFPRIISFAPLVNHPSLNVMHKIGLRKLREFDHPALPEGHEYRRHALFGLTADEFVSGDRQAQATVGRYRTAAVLPGGTAQADNGN